MSESHRPASRLNDRDHTRLLPKAWCAAPLEHITTKIVDGTHHTPTYLDHGVPFISVKDVRNGLVHFDDCKFISPQEHAALIQRCKPENGDILITKSGTIGRIAVVRTIEHFSLFVSVALLKPCKEISPEWIAYFLQHWMYSINISNDIKGTAIKNLHLEDLRLINILLAPLNEQRRIVAKIDELFSDLDAGIVALKRAKANLKRYRAAVLKAAIEGKLTADWRANHPKTEPATKLLERILVEHRKRWEADQLAKFALAKKGPPKNWKDKYVEPIPPNTAILPELPEGWCWASVQQVGFVQLGRQRAPQNHKGPYMRPYLRVANVFEDRIKLDDVMEMNFTPQEFETFRLSYGDILLNEGQSMELVGRPAMFRDEMSDVCFTNSLVRFRAYDGVDAAYALKVFLAYLKNGRFQKVATITVNIAHLGAGRFSEIEFPLPPIEEQAAIIEEVDRHFSLIDAAEKAITLDLSRAARLRQSILKQAFEGQLVPQDPTDEPAKVLLERIKVDAHTKATIALTSKSNKIPSRNKPAVKSK